MVSNGKYACRLASKVASITSLHVHTPVKPEHWLLSAMASPFASSPRTPMSRRATRMSLFPVTSMPARRMRDSDAPAVTASLSSFAPSSSGQPSMRICVSALIPSKVRQPLSYDRLGRLTNVRREMVAGRFSTLTGEVSARVRLASGEPVASNASRRGHCDASMAVARVLTMFNSLRNGSEPSGGSVMGA